MYDVGIVTFGQYMKGLRAISTSLFPSVDPFVHVYVWHSSVHPSTYLYFCGYICKSIGHLYMAF